MHPSHGGRRRRPHKKLIAWQKAIELCVEIYSLTSTFPEEERFGLSSQMKRASVSVSSNISEGAAGRTDKSFLNYLIQADGSLSELDSQLEICRRLGFAPETRLETIECLLDETSALIGGLKKSLKNKAS